MLLRKCLCGKLLGCTEPDGFQRTCFRDLCDIPFWQKCKIRTNKLLLVSHGLCNYCLEKARGRKKS